MDKREKGYHKLIVWQKFQKLLICTYKLTDKIPKTEEFGLKSQMRRAIVSVLSNFVEDYLKKSIKEKLHFMETSETSLFELEAQSEICNLLQYWTETDFEEFEQLRREAGYFLFR